MPIPPGILIEMLKYNTPIFLAIRSISPFSFSNQEDKVEIRSGRLLSIEFTKPFTFKMLKYALYGVKSAIKSIFKSSYSFVIKFPNPDKSS